MKIAERKKEKKRLKNEKKDLNCEMHACLIIMEKKKNCEKREGVGCGRYIWKKDKKKEKKETTERKNNNNAKKRTI